ncbi:MAG TPA: Ada metal-binding domain-containing protein [Pyrinomonadaceae bacterium]|jgi:hypothetical protein
MPTLAPTYWPSARQFAEAIQCPALCFSNPHLRDTLPAVDRLGMPLVTSGQFAYVYKLKPSGGGAYAVRCFRSHLGDRERRYQLIDEHLRHHRLPALAGFAYEPQGILVNGRRFPILSMEWIEGPTLDVYLDEVMGRRDVLLHLADEWLRLMQSLREAGVAHGDLQHGNIIVEHGALRLVDLDGMFVSAMAGWQAVEMGHQHYQHPSRAASFFDASLDNFSSLVVYLSLISLAERPELWAEHHDENLIFTKSDFVAPDASALFEKIKGIGPEQRRLAEALEVLAQSQPLDALSVLELVERKEKKKLPSWMVAPQGMEIAGRTREATPAEAAALGATTTQWASWQPKRASRVLPSTPGSSAVQSVFSGPALAQSAPAAPHVPRDPSDIGANALFYSKELAKKTAVLWWVVLVVFQDIPASIFDLTEFAALMLTIIFGVASILIYGLGRATIEARAAQKLNSSLGRPSALPPAANSPHALPFWLWNMPATSAQPMPVAHAVQTPPPLPPAAALASPIVGSRVLAIYHLPTCEWALKISQNNCVDFRSAAAAQAAGYHPCQVCTP